MSNLGTTSARAKGGFDNNSHSQLGDYTVDILVNL